MGRTDGDLLNWELSNYVANSAVTHLPQVKSIRRDIIELGLLLLLDRILHTTPQFIASNFNGKNLFGRRVDYPTEQRDSSRHGGKRSMCFLWEDEQEMGLIGRD